jgi:hypothetical protein
MLESERWMTSSPLSKQTAESFETFRDTPTTAATPATATAITDDERQLASFHNAIKQDVNAHPKTGIYGSDALKQVLIVTVCRMYSIRRLSLLRAHRRSYSNNSAISFTLSLS